MECGTLTWPLPKGLVHIQLPMMSLLYTTFLCKMHIFTWWSFIVQFPLLEKYCFLFFCLIIFINLEGNLSLFEIEKGIRQSCFNKSTRREDMSVISPLSNHKMIVATQVLQSTSQGSPLYLWGSVKHLWLVTKIQYKKTLAMMINYHDYLAYRCFIG